MLFRSLEVSLCPDFIEDRGHTFGRDLSDQDKRALIEYMKYFCEPSPIERPVRGVHSQRKGKLLLNHLSLLPLAGALILTASVAWSANEPAAPISVEMKSIS